MVNDRGPLDRISRYAQGTLGEEETRNLETALRADANLRRDFLEYLNVDAALAECAALPEGDLVGPPDARDAERRFRPGPSLAVAAIALLLVTAVIWVGRSVWIRSRTLAVEVLSADQVELEGRETVLRQGERLMVSRLQVKRGSLRVQLESGVALDFLGPVEGVFEGPGRFRLAHGGLNVDVGSRGKGFTVATAAGDVVDLGTRFGVSVSQSGKADIAVFSGEVRVREPGVGIVTISEGEALRLHVGHQADRLLTVPLKREEMALDAAGVAPAVVSVADNIAEADFRRFYGVVSAGMEAGTLVYTDKPRVTWQPAEGAAFPSELRGADVVRTFHTDRHELDLKITLHLARASAVYVMHDARTPALDWLERGFEDTPRRVRSGPWNPVPAVRDIAADARGEIYVEYTVWRAHVPAGGSIELGPPHVRGEGGAKVMFGIAVKQDEFYTNRRELTGGER